MDQGKIGKIIKIKVDEEDVNFYSTTGNITGVMNWGGTPDVGIKFQVAALLEDATEENLKEAISYNVSPYPYVSTTLKYLGTKYVEKLGDRTGMAMSETKGWGINNYDDTQLHHPTDIRNGLFGYGIGYHYSGGANGTKNANISFRPVIWNLD